MSSLFQITDALRQALTALAEPAPNDDATSDDYQQWRAGQREAEAVVAQLDVDLKEKLRAYVALAQELKVQREVREAALDRINANVIKPIQLAIARDSAKEDWLLATAQAVIVQHGLALPLKYTEFTVSRRKSPPRCEVLDVNALPPDYLRLVPAVLEPDRKKILSELKEGVIIPGAALAPVTYSLTVK
jgi:hypothetical protein